MEIQIELMQLIFWTSAQAVVTTVPHPCASCWQGVWRWRVPYWTWPGVEGPSSWPVLPLQFFLGAFFPLDPSGLKKRRLLSAHPSASSDRNPLWTDRQIRLKTLPSLYYEHVVGKYRTFVQITETRQRLTSRHNWVFFTCKSEGSKFSAPWRKIDSTPQKLATRNLVWLSFVADWRQNETKYGETFSVCISADVWMDSSTR